MRYPLLASLLICLGIFAHPSTAQEKETFLNVTVENSKGSLITGLKAENFHLVENGKLQEIKSFQNENKPISVGFLLDISPSMTYSISNKKINRIDWGRQAILDFLGKSRKDNEYFLISFSEKAVLLSDHTNHSEITTSIKNDSNFVVRNKGRTALYDAMTLALQKMSKARNEKQVLFVLSDGQDNRSVYEYKEIERLVKETNVIIYALAPYDPEYPYPSSLSTEVETRMGNLTDISGGRLFFSSRLDDTVKIAGWIASILQNQYRIGFVPDVSDKQNMWRRLELKLEFSKAEKKQIGTTHIKHRKGYYPLSVLVANN